MDMQSVTAAFNAIAEMAHLVEHHVFDGDDDGVYFNYTFGTLRARDLWGVIRTKIYNNREFGVHMSRASIAVCSSEAGWDEYLLLHHFDPQVNLDGETAL